MACNRHGGQALTAADERLPTSKGNAQAKRTLTRRRRIAPPTMPKPPIIIAQVAGSGTAVTGSVCAGARAVTLMLSIAGITTSSIEDPGPLGAEPLRR